MGQGSEAIEEFAQTARDAGLILSEDLIRYAEDLTDRMNILQKQLQTTFSTAVLSSLKALEEGFSAFVEDLKEGSRAAAFLTGAVAAVALAITSKLIPALIRLAASNPFIALGTAAAAAAVYIVTNWEKVQIMFDYFLPSAWEHAKGVLFSVLDAMTSAVGRAVKFWGEKLSDFITLLANFAEQANDIPALGIVIPDAAITGLKKLAIAVDVGSASWDGYKIASEEALLESGRLWLEGYAALDKLGKKTKEAADEQDKFNKNMKGWGCAGRGNENGG